MLGFDGRFFVSLNCRGFVDFFMPGFVLWHIPEWLILLNLPVAQFDQVRCGCFASMPDSVVIAGSTFLPLISYRFCTRPDRDFDRCRLLVLICLNSTILLSVFCIISYIITNNIILWGRVFTPLLRHIRIPRVLFSAHCMRWIWFIFSHGGHTDGLSLGAYFRGEIAAWSWLNHPSF